MILHPFPFFPHILISQCIHLQLRNYKNILKKLHLVADDKHDLPPDHEWAKPYQNHPVEELRAMAVRRNLASPLGASSATKSDLVKKLAHGDYADYDHEKFAEWVRR